MAEFTRGAGGVRPPSFVPRHIARYFCFTLGLCRAVGHLIGHFLARPFAFLEVRRERGVCSVPGSEFSHLEFDNRVISNDDDEHCCRYVTSDVEKHRALASVQDAFSGKSGIGKALRGNGLYRDVVFIGHDVDADVAQSARAESTLL